MSWKRLTLLMLGLALVGGASLLHVAMHGKLDTTVIEVKGRKLTVEVARTDFQRARGLMLRTQVPEGTGMLFVFEDDQPRGFWMKNTKTPLDILYFDENRRLVAMWQDVPPCTQDPCPTYPSRVAVRYVLEVKGGGSKTMGLREGDVFTLAQPLPHP